MTGDISTHTGSGGRRRVGRLINSSAKMAIVGMLASVATLGFTLWIQYLMVRQRNVGQPLMQASLRLEDLLDQTFVELRGWIAYGDEGAKEARRRLWNEDIVPSLDRLDEAARTLQAEGVLADSAALREQLRELRYYQWYVEDVARAATNEPARVMYKDTLLPMGERVEVHLDAAIASRPAVPALTSAGRALLTSYLATDRALLELLRQGTAILPRGRSRARRR